MQGVAYGKVSEGALARVERMVLSSSNTRVKPAVTKASIVITWRVPDIYGFTDVFAGELFERERTIRSVDHEVKGSGGEKYGIGRRRMTVYSMSANLITKRFLSSTDARVWIWRSCA